MNECEKKKKKKTHVRTTCCHLLLAFKQIGLGNPLYIMTKSEHAKKKKRKSSFNA